MHEAIFFMIDELDRLAWGLFLFENKNQIKLKKQSTTHDNEFLFILVDDYLKLSKNKRKRDK